MTKRRDEGANRDPETRTEIEERSRRISKLSDPLRGDPGEVVVGESALWERLYDQLNQVNASYSRSREEIFSPELPELEYPIAEAIRRTSLIKYHYHDQNGHLSENLNGREATKLYLYFDLSPLHESDVAGNTSDEEFREMLGISNPVSQPTLSRMPGRMGEKTRHMYASEAETLVRQLQGGRYESWVRDPTPDTIGTSQPA